ncbi:MAG: GntR family transcriptional regulator [Hyphomicrobiales bacterium]|nr:MAG: GntR family transcriptional regulator [Hyphomicrobiales bacterium]
MNIEQSISSISRQSLHVELVERLRDLIVDGTLAAGEKIPERELCERFGVSRTPMREALKVLAADGLVSLAPNRGAWVSKITVTELEEVFPIMGALEGLSGEMACLHISDQQIADIRKIHHEMVAHFKAGELNEYFSANQAIHEAILEAANNPTLRTMYRTLAARIRRARYLANMTDERWAEAMDEHEQILQALEGREGEKLAMILREHLKNKFDTVRQWLVDEEAES